MRCHPADRRGGAASRPFQRGQRRSSRPAAVAAAWLAAVVVAVAGIVAACAPSDEGSPDATPTPASAAPSASGEPGPSPTPWPANAVEVMVAFGTADAEIEEAVGDLQAALDNEDVELMHDAAEQFATILDRMLERTGALTDYPGTAELGGNLEAAYTLLRDGAAMIRDATASGDSAGVVAGYAKLFEGLELYAHQRQALSDAATQALLMRRNLVR